MSEASEPQQMTGATLAQELLDCLTIGLEVDEFDVANLEEAAKRLREWDYMRAGGCARDQRTTQYCAEAVAATERAEKAERALRELEAVSLLPKGWFRNESDPPGMIVYYGDRGPSGPWLSIVEPGDGDSWDWTGGYDSDGNELTGTEPTRTQACLAAQAALEGGDDE